MPDDHSSRTSVTLLGRLRQGPQDRAAWQEFVARYEPKILQWCRGWQLQESDARDVTQDVLLKLQGLLAKFAYDPSKSFRGWLRTLTHHAWRDLVEDRRRAGAGSGDTAMQTFFESIAARDTLVDQLEAEHRNELLELTVIADIPGIAARVAIPSGMSLLFASGEAQRTTMLAAGAMACAHSMSSAISTPAP